MGDSVALWEPHRLEENHPSILCEPLNLSLAQLPIVFTPKQETDALPPSLSPFQKETIRRIEASFCERGCFLLGDGTGVGKGRTIAGLILKRRLANSEFKTAWISASKRLEEEAAAEWSAIGGGEVAPFASCVFFCGYASLINLKTRSTLIEWLQSSPQAMLVLDECHYLRNASLSSKKVCSVCKLLSNSVPILYSSATACSSPKHLLYLGKLGIFGTEESPFSTHVELSVAMRKNGASLMEMMAIDLKAKGAYLARHLDFSSVTLRSEQIALNHLEEGVYNMYCNEVQETRDSFGMRRQSFFQRLLTGFKTQRAIDIAKLELHRGKSVVISLVTTGEANLKRMEGDTLFHLPVVQGGGELGSSASFLPINPIDHIVNAIGANNISELSGRTKRPVQKQSGEITLEPVPSITEEAELFQTGRKKIAILTKAGGTGISLHDAKDGRPRVHVILEIPWSAEDILQQMGRTHRSGTQHTVEYILLTTDVPSEVRFATSLVQKLRMLGALIKADRTSCVMSTLSTPHWTAATKRSIEMCILLSSRNTADVADEADDFGLDTRAINMTTEECIRLFEAEPDITAVNLKKIVLRAIWNNKTQARRAARTLFPGDFDMMRRKWNRSTHTLFPKAVQERIHTFFLCAQSEESRFLHLLDKDILHLIAEKIASPCSFRDAHQLRDRLDRLSVRNLEQMTTERILNNLLCLEVHLQRTFFDLASAFSMHTSRSTCNDLLAFAEKRAGSKQLKANICDIQCKSILQPNTNATSRETQRVFIRVSYHYKHVEAPPENVEEVLQHKITRKICWAKEDTLLFTTGETRDLVSKDSYWNYEKVTRNDWIRQAKTIQNNAEKRRQNIASVYAIQTQNGMREWDTSMKQVIRVPESPFGPARIGLLMSITKHQTSTP